MGQGSRPHRREECDIDMPGFIGIEVAVGRERDSALGPVAADLELMRRDLWPLLDRSDVAIRGHGYPDRPRAVGAGEKGERVAGVRLGLQGILKG